MAYRRDKEMSLVPVPVLAAVAIDVYGEIRPRRNLIALVVRRVGVLAVRIDRQRARVHYWIYVSEPCGSTKSRHTDDSHFTLVAKKCHRTEGPTYLDAHRDKSLGVRWLVWCQFTIDLL